ncbi:MAG: type II secretion system protein [Acidobacteriota bacterium]|nr:type II secretion system protein [Acidobacteriota bacterium]
MNILRKNNRGFTLIELISALLIMGIVAAVVVSRVGTSNNEVIAQIEVVKSHLRYAQSRAMNSELIWGIRFDTDKYWLFKEGKKVTFPGEDPNEKPDTDPEDVSLPSGMSVGTEIVSFKSWGKPYTDASGTSLQSGNRTIVFSPFLTNHAIIITQNTGFIE